MSNSFIVRPPPGPVTAGAGLSDGRINCTEQSFDINIKTAGPEVFSRAPEAVVPYVATLHVPQLVLGHLRVHSDEASPGASHGGRGESVGETPQPSSQTIPHSKPAFSPQ